MLTRRRLLAALAGIPGVAAVAKLVGLGPEPTAPILAALKGAPATVQGDEFYTWSGDIPPRVLKVCAPFRENDTAIYLTGAEQPPNMVVLVPGDRPLYVLLRRAFCKMPNPERHGYFAVRLDQVEHNRRLVRDGEDALLLGLSEHVFGSWSV